MPFEKQMVSVRNDTFRIVVRSDGSGYPLVFLAGYEDTWNSWLDELTRRGRAIHQ